MKLVPDHMVEIIWERYEDGYDCALWISNPDRAQDGRWVLNSDPLYKALIPVLSILEPLWKGGCESQYSLTMTEYTAITGREQLP